jgi:hypothetical protein
MFDAPILVGAWYPIPAFENWFINFGIIMLYKWISSMG